MNRLVFYTPIICSNRSYLILPNIGRNFGSGAHKHVDKQSHAHGHDHGHGHDDHQNDMPEFTPLDEIDGKYSLLGTTFSNEFDEILTSNCITPTVDLISFHEKWIEKINNAKSPVHLVATDMGQAISDSAKAMGPLMNSIFGNSELSTTVVAQLNSRILTLEGDIRKLQLELEKLKKSPGTVPIVIAREAMRSLENYIVLKVMVSKSQMKKYAVYDIDDIKKKMPESMSLFARI